MSLCRRLSDQLRGAVVRRRLLCILRPGTILSLLACTLFSGVLGHVYIEDICASSALAFHAEDSGTIASPNPPQTYWRKCYIRLTNLKRGDFLFIQFAPGSYLKSRWKWLSGYSYDFIQLDYGEKLYGHLTDKKIVTKIESANVTINFYLDVTDSSEPATWCLLRYIVIPQLRTFTIGSPNISPGFIVSPAFPNTPSDKRAWSSVLQPGALLCILRWTFYEYGDYRCNGTLSNDLVLNRTYFCQAKQSFCLPFQSQASTLSFVFRYARGNSYNDHFMLVFQGNLEQAVTLCTNITAISVDHDGKGVILSPDYPTNYRGGRECKLNISATGVKVIEFNLDEFYVRYYGNNETFTRSEILKINSNSFIRYRSNLTRTFRLLVNETAPVSLSFTTRLLGSWDWNLKFTVLFTVMSCSMENNMTFTKANLSNASPFCDGDEESEIFDGTSWTCNPQTGEWLQVQKCRPRVCSLPDLVANGDYNSTSDLLTFNSSIQYTCAEGYSLIGALVLNCTKNATWDGEPPKCIPEPACPDPGPFSLVNYTLLNNSLHVNSTVEYACDSGYTLVGSSILSCFANLTWDGEAPQCVLDRVESMNSTPGAFSASVIAGISLGVILLLSLIGATVTIVVCRSALQRKQSTSSQDVLQEMDAVDVKEPAAGSSYQNTQIHVEESEYCLAGPAQEEIYYNEPATERKQPASSQEALQEMDAVDVKEPTAGRSYQNTQIPVEESEYCLAGPVQEEVYYNEPATESSAQSKFGCADGPEEGTTRTEDLRAVMVENELYNA